MTDPRAPLRERLMEDTYEKLAGALEHDGDTAGYSFLLEDDALQILREFLAAADALREGTELKVHVPTDKELERILPPLPLDKRIETIIAKYVGGAMSRHYDGENTAVVAERRIAEELTRKIRRWLPDALREGTAPAEHDPLCSEGVRAGDQTMSCDCHLSKIEPATPLVTPEGAQGWQPIETAPRHQELVFWIVTKPDEEQWRDSLGRSVNYGRQPIATLHRGRYGSWAASMKATHWRYEFTPPALVGSPAAPEQEPK